MCMRKYINLVLVVLVILLAVLCTIPVRVSILSCGSGRIGYTSSYSFIVDPAQNGTAGDNDNTSGENGTAIDGGSNILFSFFCFSLLLLFGLLYLIIRARRKTDISCYRWIDGKGAGSDHAKWKGEWSSYERGRGIGERTLLQGGPSDYGAQPGFAIGNLINWFLDKLLDWPRRR